MKHESATVTQAADGRVVVYTGDDERFEYIYKFVSRDPYTGGGRTSARDLLDHGTLYVARFGDGGAGEWLELTHGTNGLVESAGFRDQSDVLVFARKAADTVGATRMDRPEWIAVHPETHEVACSLSNNARRGEPGKPGPDAANPRAGNIYGHVIRWNEAGGDAAARTFTWSFFVLAGDPAHADPAKRGTVKGDAFGSPDGLRYDARGVLWIQTDVSPTSLGQGDYEPIGNNQMLAADPRTGEVRRFLTGPRLCEITGATFTPDGRTLFVDIQHPGESPDGLHNDPANPGKNSTWPGGPAVGRPRSATVVVTKNDGGTIGT
jgi:secreted PhoX family phosphatase